MKVFSFLITFITLPLLSISQVYVKNNYDEPFLVTLAYYEKGSVYNGWITKGWLKVLPGEEKTILHYNPTGKRIYYYAYSENEVIQGTHRFLISPKDTFTIKDADKESSKNENTEYEWYEFREINRGKSSLIKNRHTITLGE